MPYSASMLAAFVSPALFFGGAAAVAAPIVIHLLARRRFNRIRWAAMDFLIDAERRNRRRLRMEELILLALRCLAVILIALFIARPFFQPAMAGAMWGGSRSTERVFVIDDSLSMSYETADGTVFDRAKQAVRGLIQSIRQETPDDTVTIVRMSQPTAPLETGTYLDDVQTEDMLARLDALSVTQLSVNAATVFEGVAEVLDRNPSVTNAAVYFISDFQRQDWAKVDTSDAADSAVDPATDDDAGASIAAPLVAWAKDDRGLAVMLIDVGEDDAANVAVTELSLRAGRLVAGASGVVRAKVANFTGRSIENVELKLTVGQLAQPQKAIRNLASRQQAMVDMEAEFPRAGFEAVRVEIKSDSLPADDVRYLATDVADAIAVLVVNGEPSSESFNDEVNLLTTALRPEGDVFSGNEVVVVDETDLDDAKLSTFHVVVLANVYRVSEPAVEQLERFVRGGGGVIFFLGDQVDADLYNTAFYRDGDGLLPAALTEIVRASKAAHLVVTDRLHPAMRGVSSAGDPLGIGQIPFFEYFGCRALDSATPNFDNDGPRPTAARVVARFDDADQHPAILERTFGNGRVIMVTTSADKEWNDWPAHPTFLPIMVELVRHAARLSDVGTEQWVGAPIELPLDPALFAPEAIVRTPAYPDEREVVVTASAAADGHGMVLIWEHTEKAGVYQFVLKRREGIDAPIDTETVRLVAVNVDPRESDLASAQEDELHSAMGDVSFEYVKGTDDLSGNTVEARTEFWRVFLLATAVVLMMEQWLAWHWGRRR